MFVQHEEEGGEEVTDGEVGSDSETMLPMEKLERLATSQNPFRRQMACRLLPDTLKQVTSAQEVAEIRNIIMTMADDCESMVRCELIEQILRLAVLCQQDDNLVFMIKNHLIPTTVKLLMDVDSQVRKTCHAALLTLLEHNMIDEHTFDKLVYPVVISLTEMDHSMMEFRISGVMLMGKMCSLISREVTERFLIDKFNSLCCDSDSKMREVCAKNYGNFTAVVGANGEMIKQFVRLCRDHAWEVRKACAEIFMFVSCTCNLEDKRNILTNVFVSFLTETTFMVCLSAYKTLGAFIATFAQPSITCLAYNEQNELVLVSKNGDFEFVPPLKTYSYDFTNFVGLTIRTEDANQESVVVFNNNIQDDDDDDEVEVSGGDGDNVLTSPQQHCDNLDQFNSFQYWKTPLPQLELELQQLAVDNNLKLDLTCIDDELATTPDSGWNSADTTPPPTQTQCPVDNMLYKLSTPNTSTARENVARSKRRLIQDIVPQCLVDYFVSMTDRQMTELPRHCAYCLPAVVLTLGVNNWHILRSTYKDLSLNVQWRVRHTVASCIHELAEILGKDIAGQDLAPIFGGFIKDLDEVRAGALQHMAAFFKLLPTSERNSFLPSLKEFLCTDNKRNWRFREELAGQLLQCIELFSPAQCDIYIVEIAVGLLNDKVAAVRLKAIELMSTIISHILDEKIFLKSLIDELGAEFADSKLWRRRQVYILLCTALFKLQTLPSQELSNMLLPTLLKLSSDQVPNVRLSVIHCLSSINTRWLPSCQIQQVQQVIKKLSVDDDFDVMCSLHDSFRGEIIDDELQ